MKYLQEKSLAYAVGFAILGLITFDPWRSPRMAASSRRDFLAGSLTGSAMLGAAPSQATAGAATPARQATGVKVGEVTDSAAIVWMRHTRNAEHNATGTVFPHADRGRQLPADTSIESLRGACPGAPGRVRVRYSTSADLANARTTDWQQVTADTDFTHQFPLTELRPATTYYYAAEASDSDGRQPEQPLRGRFETAPRADDFADITFTVITCMMYRDLDHADGFHMFPAMSALSPKFCVSTGDNVYYDSDDIRVNSIELARHHWHRMAGLPRHRDFYLRVPGYWEKDDHDCYFNDCWPGMTSKSMLPFTFEEGLRVYREQTPMGRLPYRTFRWGRGLQIWLMEGRDFRSANTMKDGPNKSIWGAEQKKWLKDSLIASDATFKVLINPTPIVGPDRKNKSDNHSNETFQHEGDEIRRFLQKHVPQRLITVCGDRHWQYHSVHPDTGVHEFSCGPASDIHASGSPGMNKQYHRFHRVNGGFLSVTVTRLDRQPTMIMRHHDVMGKVVYEYRMT